MNARDAGAQAAFDAVMQESFAPLPVVRITCAADIKPEPIRWLWDGWLARGKFHIFAGQAGTGKTTIAIALAATVSSGGRFPDGTRAPVGGVLIWSGEDSAQDTLVPRLLAAGADLRRVHFIGDVQHGDELRSFDPANVAAAKTFIMAASANFTAGCPPARKHRKARPGRLRRCGWGTPGGLRKIPRRRASRLPWADEAAYYSGNTRSDTGSERTLNIPRKRASRLLSEKGVTGNE